MRKSGNIWAEGIISPASNILYSCQPKWYWQFLSVWMLPISSFSYFMCSILTSSRENLFIFRFSFFQEVVWLTYLKEKGSTTYENAKKMAYMVRNFKCLRSFWLWSWHWKLTFEDQVLAFFDISKWTPAIDNQYLFLHQFVHFHFFAKRKYVLKVS